MDDWIKSYKDRDYPCYLKIGECYVWLTEKFISYTSHSDIVLNGMVLTPGCHINKDQYDYIVSVAEIPTGDDPQFTL